MNDSNEWELESEEYVRLKIDNIQKIKQQANGIMKFNSLKYKKIEENQKEYIGKIQNFFEGEVYPFLSINNKEEITSDKNEVNNINSNSLYNVSNRKISMDEFHFQNIKLQNNNYNYTIKSEVGSSMFFKIDDISDKFESSTSKDLTYIGKSEKFIEATTKIFKSQPTKNSNSMLKKTKREIRYKLIESKKKKSILLEMINSNSNVQKTQQENDNFVKSSSNTNELKINPNIPLNRSGKKKRKKLFSYKKNSTVIELKRLTKEEVI